MAAGRVRFELTVPHRRRPIPGVSFHVAGLPDDERTVVDSIPVTTLPRTLFDLAGQLTEGQLEAAVGEAEAAGFTDALSLHDLIARYPRRRGVGRLRRVLTRLDGEGLILRSELERIFYALLADRGLPRPATNVVIEFAGESYECDCVWRSRRLVVELDGRRWHERRKTAAADRIRDRHLAVAGWTVVRITWEQLRDGAAAVMDDLESLIYTHQLRRRSSAGRALHS